MEDVIFQQDNDLKHTSAKAKKWFQEYNVHVLGQLNPLTSILLNTSGITSRKSSMNLQGGWRSFGQGYRSNGTGLWKRNVRNWLKVCLIGSRQYIRQRGLYKVLKCKWMTRGQNCFNELQLCDSWFNCCMWTYDVIVYYVIYLPFIVFYFQWYRSVFPKVTNIGTVLSPTVLDMVIDRKSVV